MAPGVPQTPASPPPPEPAPVPVVVHYTLKEVRDKLDVCRVELHDALEIVEEHPATRGCICDRCARLRECRTELDTWLDRFLEIRGR